MLPSGGTEEEGEVEKERERGRENLGERVKSEDKGQKAREKLVKIGKGKKAVRQTKE